MSAGVFWSRRPLHRLFFRSAKANSSQSALSSAAHRVQDPKVTTPLGSSEKTRTSTGGDSNLAFANVKNPLDSTRLDRYLASINGANSEPTLDDVEHCKPQSFSRPDSSDYVVEYTNLLENLCRSFSKDQLRRFTELYKLDPIWSRSSRRKTEYAESIIEKAWGWPSLKEIERKRRDVTETLVKSFTVTPSQLFLIMGKDGADLLQLSIQYNVHISVMSSPLALRVEGLRGSLKGLAEHISSLKKGITEKIFELPSGGPIRPDLLQRISRLSGAYVENHGNRGKVRICARDLSDIAAAEKLALRASLETGIQEHTVCYNPPNKIRDSPIEISEPPRYAVYPFIAPRPLLWTMHPGIAFRLRRVADWLGVDCHEDIVSTGGLTGNMHRLLTLNGDGESLSRLICSASPEGALYSWRTITASLGHILIPSRDNSQRDVIFPPLSGTLGLPDILEWVEASGTALTFVPSVSPATMAATTDGQRYIHRLIYKTLPQMADLALKSPQHVLKFDMDLSCLSPTNTLSTQYFDNVSTDNDMLSSESNLGANSQSSRANAGSLYGTMGSGRETSLQVGREAYVNLMMPDRPMDIQLCTFDWESISLTHQPQILRKYANELRGFLAKAAQLSQPDPPTTFTYEGRTYYLYESLNMRRGNHPDLLSTSDGCYIDNIEAFQHAQQMEFCQVTLNGTTDGPGWKRFLAACDQLTVMSLESRSKKY